MHSTAYGKNKAARGRHKTFTYYIFDYDTYTKCCSLFLQNAAIAITKRRVTKYVVIERCPTTSHHVFFFKTPSQTLQNTFQNVFWQTPSRRPLRRFKTRYKTFFSKALTNAFKTHSQKLENTLQNVFFKGFNKRLQNALSEA